MPSIAGNVSVAANTQSANLLAGEPFEFLSRPSLISVYMTGASAGLEADFLIGGAAQVLGNVIPPTNRSPLRLEDGIAQAGGAAGDRLFLTALNTTAGAIVANWIIDIAPVG